MQANRTGYSPIELGGPEARPATPLLARILGEFEAAQKQRPPRALGRHWSVFRADFDRLIRTDALWPVFRRYGISFGFDNTLKRSDAARDPKMKPALKRHAGNLVHAWSFDQEALLRSVRGTIQLCAGMLDATTLQRLSETRIGDPPTVRFADLSCELDVHDVMLVYFAKRLIDDILPVHLDREPLQALEIGGGYGGLVHKILRALPGTGFTLLDLPEPLAVQTYYLAIAEPQAMAAGAFRFLGPSGLEQIADLRFDMAVNLRSMMEMPADYVAYYIDRIQRQLVPGGLFYCVNAYSKSTSGEAITLADYPFDECWDLLDARAVPFDPHIGELLLRRRQDRSGDFAPSLQAACRSGAG